MKSKFYLLLGMLLVIASCKNHTEKVIRHWLGRTMTLTVNQKQIVIGKRPIKIESDFYIVNYIDSIGCISCKMALPKWKSFGAYVDSITSQHIPVIFVVQESVRRNLLFELKADDYTPDYIIVDKNNSLQKKYQFPAETDMQTFLLDRSNKVIAIGNPINHDKVLSLYVSYITKKRKIDMNG